MVEWLPRHLRDSSERIKRFYLDFGYKSGIDKERARKYVAVNEILLRCFSDGMNLEEIYETLGESYWGVVETSELDNMSLERIGKVADILKVNIDGLLNK